MWLFFKHTIMLTVIGHWKNFRFFLATAFVVALSLVFELVTPFCFKQLIEISEDFGKGFEVLCFFALSYVICWTVSHLLLRVRALMVKKSSQKTANLILQRVLKNTLDPINKHSSPSPHHIDLFYREINSCIEFFVWHLAPTVLQIIFTLIIVFKYTGIATATIFGLTITGYFFVLFFGFKKINTYQKTALEKTIEFSQKIFDGFSHLNLLHFFKSEKSYGQILNKEIETTQKVKDKSLFQTEKILSLQILFLGVGLLCLLALMSWNIFLKKIAASDLIIIQSYFLQLTLPLTYFGFMMTNLKEVNASIHIFKKFLESSTVSSFSEQSLADQLVFPENTDVVLNFDKISFEMDGRKIIDQISFCLKKGELVVLTGASGQGKTTLINLLMRQLSPSAGSITLCGSPLTKVSDENLYDFISIVPQTVQVFNQTIRENLVVFQKINEELTSKIPKILETVCLSEKIQTLPEGLETKINETSPYLSRGELQRLTLARALLKPAELYIFDEPTASLDDETAKKVFDGVIKHLQQKTIFIITHQKNIMRHADKLFILNGENKLTILEKPIDLDEKDFINFFHPASSLM